MNGKGGGVSGDASGVTGANPRFSSDMEQAAESIKKLAGLEFDSLYFGHGDPLEGNASQLVGELAAEL
jgi:glyoxylase-like metal-dependent hydrolase (beta-lactamase superfamily II)